MQATEVVHEPNRMHKYANGSKPHLYLLGGWGYSIVMWACISKAGYGYGHTLKDAYKRWYNSANGLQRL